MDKQYRFTILVDLWNSGRLTQFIPIPGGEHGFFALVDSGTNEVTHVYRSILEVEVVDGFLHIVCEDGKLVRKVTFNLISDGSYSFTGCNFVESLDSYLTTKDVENDY